MAPCHQPTIVQPPALGGGGLLCTPSNLHPSHSGGGVRTRYTYLPADSETIAVKQADSETGEQQPFKDFKGVSLDIKGPVQVPLPALRDCEGTARLLAGAANSAADFWRRMSKAEDSIPQDLRPALAQLSSNLSAVVQYSWRNV